MPAPYNSETTGEEVVEDLKAHIKGKVILTTGVSPGGLGAFFVEQIAAAQPKLLILAGRNTAKVDTTVQKIRQMTNGTVETRTLGLDLGSLAKVREAAAEVNAYPETIDVLVNNAGIMATDYSTTVDGFESQFGIDHVAPWLFTNLIIEKILASKAPRIVNVASDGYRLSPIRFFDYGFREGETYSRWRAYGQGKTGNVLTAISLAEKLGPKGLVALSIHPGIIMTNLPNHLDMEQDFKGLTEYNREIGAAPGGEWETWAMKSPSQGVANHIIASFDPSLKEYNGRFLSDGQVLDLDVMEPHGISSREAKKLWKLSEELVGQNFDF